MTAPPERAKLLDLYSTHEPDGLPTFLFELYPQFLSAYHHLGDASSCPHGGPGISYGMWDPDCDGATTLVRVVKWGAPETPIPTALYRLRDKAGELLYVGITDNPERRWKDHEKDKAWWPQVAARSVEWLPTRDLALSAEAKTIRAERPRHNLQHNGEKV